MGTVGGTETGRVTTRTQRVTRSQRPSGASAGAGDVTMAVAETTAEIPAVSTSGRAPAVGTPARANWAEGTVREQNVSVVLPDGSLWYPGTPKREPAPFVLRLVVWLLFFVLLLGAAGLAVEHVHPNWLAFARNDSSGAVVLPGTGGTPSGNAGAASGSTVSGGFHLIRNSKSGATYATGAQHYSLVITFTHPVWTVVASPAGSKNFLLEQTLQPNASPKRVLIDGTASVQLSAATTSIGVIVNNKTVGSVADPAVGSTYIFRPTAR